MNIHLQDLVRYGTRWFAHHRALVIVLALVVTAVGCGIPGDNNDDTRLYLGGVRNFPEGNGTELFRSDSEEFTGRFVDGDGRGFRIESDGGVRGTLVVDVFTDGRDLPSTLTEGLDGVVVRAVPTLEFVGGFNERPTLRLFDPEDGKLLWAASAAGSPSAAHPRLTTGALSSSTFNQWCQNYREVYALTSEDDPTELVAGQRGEIRLGTDRYDVLHLVTDQITQSPVCEDVSRPVSSDYLLRLTSRGE